MYSTQSSYSRPNSSREPKNTKLCLIYIDWTPPVLGPAPSTSQISTHLVMAVSFGSAELRLCLGSDVELDCHVASLTSRLSLLSVLIITTAIAAKAVMRCNRGGSSSLLILNPFSPAAQPTSSPGHLSCACPIDDECCRTYSGLKICLEHIDTIKQDSVTVLHKLRADVPMQFASCTPSVDVFQPLLSQLIK